MHKKTPAIMIQGTCSNAGKSLVTAGLCRIFAQDGLRPAPFKAQNMALNSFVTADGKELGRAQALQALACGLPPDSRMNPVLLKPSSDVGSQVIIMGKAVGHMRVAEYIAYKEQAFSSVTQAYDSLAAESGLMVIEGAGSPAEINLQAHDIVNMRMAHYAEAPVLLVGDIDRGGVFAALVGTMTLLPTADQERVAGFILNKFRGDASLLAPAFTEISQRTGKPFFGVVPWVAQHGLPEEDSVSFKLHVDSPTATSSDSAPVDIVLLDLPHISNATDIDALRVEPDVRVRVVGRPEKLGQPDAIIIPGSKNTRADMQYLWDSGMAEALLKLVQAAYETGQPNPEMGHSPHEMGNSPHETGQPNPEMGNSSHETGQPSHETGQPSHETGQPSHETGHSPHEMGNSSHETGNSSRKTGHASTTKPRAPHSLTDALWPAATSAPRPPYAPTIVGICGGLQMLGLSVCDPLGIESSHKASADTKGLGLLPLITTLGQDKILRRTHGLHLPSGESVRGYEIHHGHTHIASGYEHLVRVNLLTKAGEALGWAAQDPSQPSTAQGYASPAQSSTHGSAPASASQPKAPRVWGSYLHGIFDEDAFRRAFVDEIRAHKGLPPVGQATPYTLEPALDRLALCLRQNLDMTAIYRLLGIA